MIDGSEKRNICQLAFERQNSHFYEKRRKIVVMWRISLKINTFPVIKT